MVQGLGVVPRSLDTSQSLPWTDRTMWGTVKIMVPFLGPYYNTGPNTGPNLGDPKKDHNFDSSPCACKTLPPHARCTIRSTDGRQLWARISRDRISLSNSNLHFALRCAPGRNTLAQGNRTILQYRAILVY